MILKEPFVRFWAEAAVSLIDVLEFTKLTVPMYWSAVVYSKLPTDTCVKNAVLDPDTFMLVVLTVIFPLSVIEGTVSHSPPGLVGRPLFLTVEVNVTKIFTPDIDWVDSTGFAENCGPYDMACISDRVAARLVVRSGTVPYATHEYGFKLVLPITATESNVTLDPFTDNTVPTSEGFELFVVLVAYTLYPGDGANIDGVMLNVKVFVLPA